MGIVLKFGGTSVGTTEKIMGIAEQIAQRKIKDKEMVIVVSAMGKMTDELIQKANQVSGKPAGRELDMLLATGEQQTIALMSLALESKGIAAISMTGYQAGIETQGPHNKNRIAAIRPEKIKQALAENKVVVVAGFQGYNALGDITTLGRGGSDTSAVALAASLGFHCEIYTDVQGIFSIDPRLYDRAQKLDQISYEEMMEMASLGAGVMEARAVEIGKKYGVEIYVAQSHSSQKGTWIREAVKVEDNVLTGLSATDNVMGVSIGNIEGKPQNIAVLFACLAKHHANIDMISQIIDKSGQVNINFTCPLEEAAYIAKAQKELKEIFPDMDMAQDLDISKLSVVGIGMRNHSGVAAKLFDIFAENNIPFQQVTTSEISISYTIPKAYKAKAVMKIAEAFHL